MSTLLRSSLGVFFIMLLSLSVFAESSSSSKFMETNMLVESNLHKNRGIIKMNSISLSNTEKFSIYNSNEKDYLVPLVLNAFLPFSIGSFYQGDTKGAVTTICGSALGYAIFYGGYFTAALSAGGGYDSEPSYEVASIGVGAMIGGGLLVLGSAFYNLYRPYKYAQDYNKELKNALGFTGDFSMELVPSINLAVASDKEASASINLVLAF